MTKFKRFMTVYSLALTLILSIAATATILVKASTISAEKTPRKMTHEVPIIATKADLSAYMDLTTQAAKSEKAPAEDNWAPATEDVVAMARVIYAEARGCSLMEQAAVAWCILNRVDNPRFPDTVIGVLEAPHQFAYSIYNPVVPELEELAADVLTRWHQEKTGADDVGRVLPATYLYFFGDGQRNHFTEQYRGSTCWDWSLPNPYED